MKIIGHSLVFGKLCGLVTNGNFSNEELEQIVKGHIKLVMETFPEIQIWDVVNEFHPNGPNEEFKIRLGDYTELAFQAAKDTNPNAKLILNDNLNQTRADGNFSSDIKIVKNLTNKGLIDGIGLHMHLDGTKNVDVNKLIEGMQAYGVPVYITELDVDMRKV